MQDTYVSLIDPPTPLRVTITGFMPLRQKHLWDLMLKVVSEFLSHSYLHSYCTTISFPGFGRLVVGLLPVYLDYCYDVNSLTIAMDSSLLRVRNSVIIIIIIIIIIIVIIIVYCLLLLLLLIAVVIISYIITYMGIIVTINS